MSRWRITVLAVLLAAPVVFLAGVGCYDLWERGWAFALWWPMAASVGTALLLSLYWHRQQKLLPRIDFSVLVHWTDRDREAWKVVEARVKDSDKLKPDELADPTFYTQTALQLASDVARVYHPTAQDPLGPLTIPELLAVVELAARDMAELVRTYVPAGHLLTVNDWRLAKQASDWYQSASKAYWMASALFTPVQTGLRFAASQFGMTRPLQLLQQNFLVWFYTAFLQRLGTYLIDLNSGRLRVGADRYRQIMAEATAPSFESTAAQAKTAPASKATGPTAPDAAEAVRRVTITLAGQVKAGKSSLINALLGEQRARTAVLPTTNEITRYELQPPDIPTRLVLLDSVGYHHTSARTDQLAATTDAALQSDVLFLVLHANNPARQADLEFLTRLKAWFGERPELKMPPILGVLTHIDLLSPFKEWAPPYDWEHPTRPKERTINDSIEATKEQLGPFLIGLVPVCIAPGKVYGIDEFLLPALSRLLDEARAVALLRCLRSEVDTGKVRKVFAQLSAIGNQAVKIFWDTSRLPKAP